MKNVEQCRLETLASSGMGRVDHCPHCGCISLHMGPLTVRMEASGVEALRQLLGAAAVQLLSPTEAPRLPQ